MLMPSCGWILLAVSYLYCYLVQMVFLQPIENHHPFEVDIFLVFLLLWGKEFVGCHFFFLEPFLSSSF